MSVSFAIAIYVVIWWTVLFAILPIGVRTQGEDDAVVPGTPASAPTRPRLVRIALLTTLVSALIFAALWGAVRHNVIDLEQWLGRTGPRSVPEMRPQK
jgi:predicted secreted protein